MTVHPYSLTKPNHGIAIHEHATLINPSSLVAHHRHPYLVRTQIHNAVYLQSLRQLMRDEDHRDLTLELVHCPGELLRGWCIETARGLVENENVGPLQ